MTECMDWNEAIEKEYEWNHREMFICDFLCSLGTKKTKVKRSLIWEDEFDFDEHFYCSLFIGFKYFNWYLVVNFSEHRFMFHQKLIYSYFGFVLDVENSSYVSKTSTKISRGRRRKSQEKGGSFEILISKSLHKLRCVICLQLRYIPTLVNCVGRILRGWLGAGWEVEHKFFPQSKVAQGYV